MGCTNTESTYNNAFVEFSLKLPHVGLVGLNRTPGVDCDFWKCFFSPDEGRFEGLFPRSPHFFAVVAAGSRFDLLMPGHVFASVLFKSAYVGWGFFLFGGGGVAAVDTAAVDAAAAAATAVGVMLLGQSCEGARARCGGITGKKQSSVLEMQADGSLFPSMAGQLDVNSSVAAVAAGVSATVDDAIAAAAAAAVAVAPAAVEFDGRTTLRQRIFPASAVDYCWQTFSLVSVPELNPSCFLAHDYRCCTYVKLALLPKDRLFPLFGKLYFSMRALPLMGTCERHKFALGHKAPTLSFPFRRNWLPEEYNLAPKRYMTDWDEIITLEGSVTHVLFKMHSYKPPVEFEDLPHWAGACHCAFILKCSGIVDKCFYDKSFLFKMNDETCAENVRHNF